MTASSSLPAKLSRPRPYRVAPRERLYAALDAQRAHGLLWITGGPGFGKTTLAAAYVAARSRPSLWYHVDEGDADPGTFFFYLGRAGEAAGRRKAALPLLTEDHARDLDAFARRFYRELYARLPRDAAVVFDALRAPAGSPLLRLVAIAAEELPDGMNVLVTSRSDPPPEFARLRLEQRLAVVGGDALRFTPGEAGALLGEDEAAVAPLVARADGWAAGLVLMREQARRGGTAPAAPAPGGEAPAFEYFAGEIFDRIPPDAQCVLLAAALLPRAHPDVLRVITEHPDPRGVLEYGYRRHLFITRNAGGPAVYQFHVLFREFLLDRARRDLGETGLRDLMRRAAEALERAGESEGVFALRRQAQDWDGAVRAVLAEAPALLAQGRFRSLAARIQALPDAVRERDAWLAYWSGIVEMNVDPPRALDHLDRAYRAFAAAGDLAGQLQAMEAAMVSYYLGWNDWRPLDRWIDEAERLLDARRRFPSPASEARVLSAFAIALAYRQPGHPRLPPSLARLQALLDRDLDPNLRVAIAARVIDGLNKVGDFGQSLRVAARVRPVMDDPAVRPLSAAWFRVWLSNQYLFEARFDEFEAVLGEARGICEHHGLDYYVPVVELFRGFGLLARGDPEAAGALLEPLAERLDPARRLDLALLGFLRAWLALERGDAAGAEREAAAAARLALVTGSAATRVICGIALCAALDAAGRIDAALDAVAEMHALLAGVTRGVLRFNVLVWEAHLRARKGEAGAARDALAAAFALGGANGYLNLYLWRPPMMARLAAHALEQGIEPGYARRLVQARQLAPPADARPDASWPWPLAIRALGGFDVLREGEPIRIAGKGQRKPLDLLKALVAFGAGGVEWTRLAAALWPDASGAAAKSSFDSTLHRLRRLLVVEGALVLDDGCLALDRRVCWLDAAAFQDAVAAVERAAAVPGAEDCHQAALRALAAYPGPLFAGEEEQPWWLGERERLRGLLVRAALAAGRRLGADGAWARAIDVYARALERDNLAEALHRETMRAQIALGRRADALRTYRRCRDLLRAAGGLAPSAETEALRRSLQDVRPA